MTGSVGIPPALSNLSSKEPDHHGESDHHGEARDDHHEEERGFHGRSAVA
jgi:hypothetical protein